MVVGGGAYGRTRVFCFHGARLLISFESLAEFGACCFCLLTEDGCLKTT